MSYEAYFLNAKNNIKQKNLNTAFANISDIRLIPLDHVTYIRFDVTAQS